MHTPGCRISAGAFMVYWANNLAFKIALNVYLSNIHPKRSVNMNFHKGLCCLRRKVFFTPRELFQMKPPSFIS